MKVLVQKGEKMGRSRQFLISCQISKNQRFVSFNQTDTDKNTLIIHSSGLYLVLPVVSLHLWNHNHI